MSDALITAADLELILQITIADATLKTMLIGIASDFIESFTGRKFLSQAYAKEAYDGDGSHEIYLKNYPATAVTLVETWDTYNNVSSQTFTEHIEYINHLTDGYIYMRGRTIPGVRNYRVTYTAGYVIASMPYDIRYACAQLCSLVYNKKGSVGALSESMGKYSIAYDKGGALISGIPVPSDIAGILNHHRRVNI